MNTLISSIDVPNIVRTTVRAVDPALPRLIGLILLHFLWQGAAVAFALALVLRMLRDRSPALRYRVACLALVAMIAAPLITCGVAMRMSTKPAVKPLAAAPAPALLRAEAFELPSSRISSVRQMPVAYSPAPAPVVARQTAGAEAKPSPWLWLVIGWGAGVLALSVWRMAGWVHLRGQLRRTSAVANPWPERVRILAGQLGVRRPVRLAQAAWVAVPCVLGFFRPVILLPAAALTGLTPMQLEAILAHELAHVRRHDYLMNLVQVIVETVLFYHPAVWWVSARVREEREFCCDDIAVATGSSAADYAAALAAAEALRQADRASIPAHLALAAIDGPLVRRVRRILGFAPPPRERRTAFIPVLVVLAGAALTVMPWMMISARAQKPPVDSAGSTTKPATVENDPRKEKGEPPTPADFVVEHRDYPLGKNDLLTISIGDLVAPGQETVKAARVSETGNISLPYLGVVKAAGLTEAELEKEIAGAYRKANLIQNSAVSVTVVEARGMTFEILGQVRQPGQYAILDSDFRLADALAQARTDISQLTRVNIYRKPVVDEHTVRDLEIALHQLGTNLGEQHPQVIAARSKLAEAQNPKSRIVGVDVAGLKADDPAWKIVIRWGDRIMVEGKPLPAAINAPANDGVFVDPQTYKLSSGDVVTLDIHDIDGPGTVKRTIVRVSEGGTIGVSYLGRVSVAGLTEAEAERKIVQAYHDANLIQSADISVETTIARGHKAIRPGGNPADLLGPPDHKTPAANAPAPAGAEARNSIVRDPSYDPEHYALEKRDRVGVKVFNAHESLPRASTTVTIDEAGNITLPDVGTIKAEGQTLVALQKEIASAYREKKLLDQPDVVATAFDIRGGLAMVIYIGDKPIGVGNERKEENAAAPEEPSAEQLALADPAMKVLLQQRQSMELEMKQLQERMGPENAPNAYNAAMRKKAAALRDRIEQYRIDLNAHFIFRLKPDGSGVLVKRNALLQGQVHGVTAKAASTIVGTIRQVHVKVGQHIKKGDVLVQLVDTELLAKLDIAKADVAEEAAAGADHAARAQKARALLTIAEYQASQARIVAPIDGVIIKATAIEGQTIQPGEELAVIVNNDALVVQTTVDQANLGSLKVGAKVRLKWGPGDDGQAPAVISFISPQVEHDSVAVEASVPAGDHGALRDGMTVSMFPSPD